MEQTTLEETTATERTVTITVATYNIWHAGNGIDEIAGVIRRSNADIIGIQEVDYLNTRSSGQDQPKLIAEAAGYDYYEFIPAIDYKGGKYGTAILSKYPIESFEYVKLDSGEREGRAIGHASINIDGKILDFYTTHLSYEEKNLRTGQFEQIAAMLAGCENYVLTADFNTQDFSEFDVLGASVMVNRTGSVHVTFPKSSSAIDNILASASFTEKKTSTITSDASDHYLLYTVLEFEK